MTQRPFTKDEIEAMRNGLMTDMKLRMEAYRILKSGDLKNLDALVPSSLGGPDVSYREILDYWKKELESPVCVCPVPTFLKRLGVDYSWNGGAKDYSDAIVACPIDFSLLGLDPKKIPDLSHLRFTDSKKKDLDEIWRQQPSKKTTKGKFPPGAFVDGPWGSGRADANGNLVVTRTAGEALQDKLDIYKGNAQGLLKTLKKGFETTISTKGKSRSR